jgi:hypothetical protein
MSIFGRENDVNEHWDPAQVQLPQMPTLPPGEDPMSSMISAALPALSAQMEGNVAALQGKETMFSGKVAASNAMYAGSEDSGQQGVMQIVQMLGQMGSQAGEMAGAPTQMFGQMGSQFGQLMQPMMQAFQGHGGGHEGSPGGQSGAGAAGGGQGLGGIGGAQQQERDEERTAQQQPETHHDSDHAGHGSVGAQAGPDVRRGLTPVPPLTLDQPHRSAEGDELGRNL